MVQKVIKKCDELFDKYLDQNMPTNVKYISDSDHILKELMINMRHLNIF